MDETPAESRALPPRYSDVLFFSGLLYPPMVGALMLLFSPGVSIPSAFVISWPLCLLPASIVYVCLTCSVGSRPHRARGRVTQRCGAVGAAVQGVALTLFVGGWAGPSALPLIAVAMAGVHAGAYVVCSFLYGKLLHYMAKKNAIK